MLSIICSKLIRILISAPYFREIITKLLEKLTVFAPHLGTFATYDNNDY